MTIGFSSSVLRLKLFSSSLHRYISFYLLFRLKEQLGSGQFGVVHHGIWRTRSETGCKDMDVAVKAVENGRKSEERVKFLQEAVVMGQFHNPYILQIFGIINEDHVSTDFV